MQFRTSVSQEIELCGWNVVGVIYKIMICPNLLTSGGFILAADYCQLELRILAHFSRDCRLIEAFNKGADVFKSIAAEWKMIDSEAVGDSTRQQAKQVYFRKKKIIISFLGRKVWCSKHWES